MPHEPYRQIALFAFAPQSPSLGWQGRQRRCAWTRFTTLRSLWDSRKGSGLFFFFVSRWLGTFGTEVLCSGDLMGTVISCPPSTSSNGAQHYWEGLRFSRVVYLLALIEVRTVSSPNQAVDRYFDHDCYDVTFSPWSSKVIKALQHFEAAVRIEVFKIRQCSPKLYQVPAKAVRTSVRFCLCRLLKRWIAVSSCCTWLLCTSLRQAKIRQRVGAHLGLRFKTRRVPR